MTGALILNGAPTTALQAATKAYVDSAVSSGTGALDTDDISEGTTNLYYTDARADARITNALVDEDNMASDSATKVPSQQSVKAYIDASILTKDNTDEITEGSSKIYLSLFLIFPSPPHIY